MRALFALLTIVVSFDCTAASVSWAFEGTVLSVFPGTDQAVLTVGDSFVWEFEVSEDAFGYDTTMVGDFSSGNFRTGQSDLGAGFLYIFANEIQGDISFDRSIGYVEGTTVEGQPFSGGFDLTDGNGQSWSTEQVFSGESLAAVFLNFQFPSGVLVVSGVEYGLDLTAVKIAPVPIPAAAWLFLSAVFGGFGLKRFRT